MEAIHLDWQGGAPMPGVDDPGRARAQVRPHAEEHHGRAGRTEEPRRGVRGAALGESSYPDEPLMAMLPGVALDELWQVVGVGERALLLVSAHGRRWWAWRAWWRWCWPGSTSAGASSRCCARSARGLREIVLSC